MANEGGQAGPDRLPQPFGHDVSRDHGLLCLPRAGQPELKGALTRISTST